MDALQRFIDAQDLDYDTALAEIKQGRKQSHWMWYIFPQLKGLGYSAMSQRYAIKDRDEAAAFLKHPVLGERLINICRELLKIKDRDAHSIFGSPDDLKLRSSMTLFSALPAADPVFGEVLEKYFWGQKDSKTQDLLSGS